MATLTFRVPDEVAVRFAAHARRQGGKSAVLRRMVDEAVGAHQAASADGAESALPAISAAFGPSTKVTLRLRVEEVNQLVAVAEARGMSRTQWITSLVRARLGATGLMVGDRPDTDGLFAHAVGYDFALVLTGVTGRDDLPVEPVPTEVADDLRSLVATRIG